MAETSFIAKLINKITGKNEEVEQTSSSRTFDRFNGYGTTTKSGKEYATPFDYSNAVEYAKWHNDIFSPEGAAYKLEQEQKQAEYDAQYAEEHKSERGKLSRILGMLGYNGLMEGLYNVTDDDENTTFLGGLKQGLVNWNPMSDEIDYHTGGDVLKNIGWEDKDPDHLSLSDVGRGVVGFAGDVLLDPLTYLNPFASAGKVLKGTGYTVDAAKQMMKETGSVSFKSLANKLNQEGLTEAQRLEILSGKGSTKYFKELAKDSPLVKNGSANVDEIANQYQNDYLRKVQHIVTDPTKKEGFRFSGLPFRDKSSDLLYKEFFSEKALRKLGDSTISPYFNSILNKIRTSKLGRNVNIANEYLKTSENSVLKSINDYVNEVIQTGETLAIKQGEVFANARHLEKLIKRVAEENNMTYEEANRAIRDAVETHEADAARFAKNLPARIKEGAFSDLFEYDDVAKTIKEKSTGRIFSSSDEMFADYLDPSTIQIIRDTARKNDEIYGQIIDEVNKIVQRPSDDLKDLFYKLTGKSLPKSGRGFNTNDILDILRVQKLLEEGFSWKDVVDKVNESTISDVASKVESIPNPNEPLSKSFFSTPYNASGLRFRLGDADNVYITEEEARNYVLTKFKRELGKYVSEEDAKAIARNIDPDLLKKFITPFEISKQNETQHHKAYVNKLLETLINHVKTNVDGAEEQLNVLTAIRNSYKESFRDYLAKTDVIWEKYYDKSLGRKPVKDTPEAREMLGKLAEINPSDKYDIFKDQAAAYWKNEGGYIKENFLNGDNTLANEIDALKKELGITKDIKPVPAYSRNAFHGDRELKEIVDTVRERSVKDKLADHLGSTPKEIEELAKASNKTPTRYLLDSIDVGDTELSKLIENYDITRQVVNEFGTSEKYKFFQTIESLWRDDYRKATDNLELPTILDDGIHNLTNLQEIEDELNHIDGIINHVSAGLNSSLTDLEIETADFLINEFNRVGSELVNEGLIEKEQLAKYAGHYIPHIKKAVVEEIFENSNEIANGSFTRHTFNDRPVFNKIRRLKKTITEINSGEQQIFDESLLNIYTAYMLRANERIHAKQNIDFIKKYFGTPFRSTSGQGFQYIKGYTPGAAFSDIEQVLKNVTRSEFATHIGQIKKQIADEILSGDLTNIIESNEDSALKMLYKKAEVEGLGEKATQFKKDLEDKLAYLESHDADEDTLKWVLDSGEEYLHGMLDAINEADTIRENLFNYIMATQINKWFKEEGNKLYGDIFARNKQSLADLSGNADDFLEFYTPNNPMQKLNEAQVEFLERYKADFESYNFTDGTYDQVNKLSRQQEAYTQANILQLFDKIQNTWKLSNTVLSPSFHIQNAASNAFQSFLGIGMDCLNPKNLRLAEKVIFLRTPDAKIKLGNKEWTHKELEHVAKRSGVINESFFAYEGQSAWDREMRVSAGRKISDMKFSGNLLKDYYDLSTVVGTNLEGVQRMNIFISELKRGATVHEAKESVNKFLYDYSELTKFEKDVMKRIFPFYTFMRKNIPTMLEQMVEQPNTFNTINKAFTEFEQMDEEGYVEKTHRNEWRQDYVEIPYSRFFSSDDRYNYGVNPQLPYQQIEVATNPDQLIGRMSPLLKLLPEMYVGQYAMTGMDIDSPLGYLAGQTAPTSLAYRWANSNDDDRAIKNLSRFLTFPTDKVKDQTVNNFSSNR